MSVFNFTSARDYLKNASASQRGFRSEIARAANCQATYISKVLAGNAFLSLEQADLICDYLKFTDYEGEYFCLICQIDRAGTQSLKKRLERQIIRLKSEGLRLKNQVTSDREISLDEQLIYYGHWQYAAVRIALSIPELQTPKVLSERLEISFSRVKEILAFLVSIGLAEKVTGEEKYVVKRNTMHLKDDSPLLTRMHCNWRYRAVDKLSNRSLGEIKDSEMHYSTVFSLSHEAATEMKAILFEAVKQARACAAPSKEETLYNLNIDFYSLVNN